MKQDHWSTVLFFKKGKFYELYEKDAGVCAAGCAALPLLSLPFLKINPTLFRLVPEIGNREFNLKITDRVNMAVR